MISDKASAGTADELQDAPLWTVRDVSSYLGVPIATLYVWRHRGTGPRAYRVGRYLRYDRSEVRRWLDELAA